MLALFVFAAIQSAAAPLAVSGKVTDAQGKPIEGAKAYVIAAEPRPEAAADCPTEFAGVGKVVTTSTDGKFTLADLDPHLTYKVVFAADHFKARRWEVNTKTKQPIAVKLTPQPEQIENDNAVTGHVSDNDGKPIAGALLRVQGEITDNSHRYGNIESVDTFAVAGDDGAYFILSGGKPGRRFDLVIEHPQFAPQIVHPAAGEPLEITLSRGVKVTGRVVKDDQPVAGVQVSLAQFNRNMERYIGMFSAGTNAEGKFTIDHVPENDEYQILATMQSLGERGCCRPVKFKVDTSDVDAGDLNVEPGVTVSGSIVMPEGKKIPPAAMAYLSVEDSFDGAQCLVKPDGGFKIVSVPTGVVRLYVHANGVMLSKENASYYGNYRSLIGQVNGDLSLRIKLDPKSNEDQWNPNEGEENYTSKVLEGVPEDAK
jgi:hypothetical protein